MLKISHSRAYVLGARFSIPRPSHTWSREVRAPAPRRAREVDARAGAHPIFLAGVCARATRGFPEQVTSVDRGARASSFRIFARVFVTTPTRGGCVASFDVFSEARVVTRLRGTPPRSFAGSGPAPRTPRPRSRRGVGRDERRREVRAPRVRGIVPEGQAEHPTDSFLREPTPTNLPRGTTRATTARP